MGNTQGIRLRISPPRKAKATAPSRPDPAFAVFGVLGGPRPEAPAGDGPSTAETSNALPSATRHALDRGQVAALGQIAHGGEGHGQPGPAAFHRLRLGVIDDLVGVGIEVDVVVAAPARGAPTTASMIIPFWRR